MTAGYDLAVVGAGIVGLAHAYAAVQRGARVIVIDRDARANRASVRNFGYVTVTGQDTREIWPLARRTQQIWSELAPRAGIEILHRGTLAVARTEAALALLEEFSRSEAAAGCELLGAAALRARAPMLKANLRGALASPHELRIEARTAVALVAHHLATAHGVTFMRETLVRSIAPPLLDTTRGEVRAARIVVCPGDDMQTLYAEALAKYRVRRCQLQMIRLAPQPQNWRLPATLMGDLSLVRYGGFAACAAAPALRAQLERECADRLAAGVHVLIAQSADGSLVLGDSHAYDATPAPFAPAAVEAMIVQEALRLADIPDTRVVERWIGTYASAATPLIVDAPHARVRLVVVASGIGMSIAFALAEDVCAELLAA